MKLAHPQGSAHRFIFEIRPPYRRARSPQIKHKKRRRAAVRRSSTEFVDYRGSANSHAWRGIGIAGFARQQEGSEPWAL
jgi:hypothetical protein